MGRFLSGTVSISYGSIQKSVAISARHAKEEPQLREQTMTFDEALDQVRELLQQRGRVTYRSLKLRYQVDDELLTGITDELIKAERVATDENGEVLVWIGEGINGEKDKRINGERESAGEKAKGGKGETRQRENGK